MGRGRAGWGQGRARRVGLGGGSLSSPLVVSRSSRPSALAWLGVREDWTAAEGSVSHHSDLKQPRRSAEPHGPETALSDPG